MVAVRQQVTERDLSKGMARANPPICAPAAVWPSRCQPAPNCPFWAATGCTIVF